MPVARDPPDDTADHQAAQSHQDCAHALTSKSGPQPVPGSRTPVLSDEDARPRTVVKRPPCTCLSTPVEMLTVVDTGGASNDDERDPGGQC